MKQQITESQWFELSGKNRLKLAKMFIDMSGTGMGIGNYGVEKEHATVAFRMTIGQMIEFLFEKDGFIFAHDTEGAWLNTTSNIVLYWDKQEQELCDELWEACKKILE